MPLRVNTNLPAVTIQRTSKANNRDLSVRIKRLASMLRVNQAADDAASLAISEGMRAEVGGYAQAVRNAEQAVNQTQVAEGALNEVNGLLTQMRELAAQGASSTLNDGNRRSVQAEYAQLSAEVDRIVISTSESTGGTEDTFQVGPNGREADRIEISLGGLRAGGSEVNLGGTSVASLQGAQDVISRLDAEISRVTEGRADIGALQNRLSFAIRANESAIENVQASESSIRDADVAEEVSAFARARILSRASTATLAQANIDSQQVLSLLGG